MNTIRFRVVQNGIVVAGVEGLDRVRLLAEINHYAAVYGEDGPVEIQQRIYRGSRPEWVASEDTRHDR